jgi:hypothetical protein
MSQRRPTTRSTSRLGLRLGRLALALGLASIVWACNAPPIPVPPPSQTASFTSALVDDGAGGQKTVWVAHGAPGQATAFARVSVFDVMQGQGVIGVAMPDGSYDSPQFDGTRGDRVQISYEPTNGEHSVDVCFQLIESTPDMPAPRCVPP